MSLATCLCQAIETMPTSIPTFAIANGVREVSVNVHYYGIGNYDEVFTMKDGSQILWNDSGFNPL